MSIKQLDAFSRIEADVDRGMNVSKTWDEKAYYEQELMNEIDISEQKRCGGIKPMSDQFPGEEYGTSNADIMESDRMTRKNQLSSDYIEKRLMSYSHKGYSIITKPDGQRVIAFIESPDGSRVAVAGGKGFLSTSDAVQAAMKQIDSIKKKLSGSSNEKADSSHTSTVAVMCGNELLMGQRRDNGKWTFPGGGCNAGEDPHAGAIRELWEEAGVRCKELEHLGSKEVAGRTGNKIHVHCFKLALDKKVQPSSFHDPDNEVSKWEWIDISNGVPSEIMIELQSPKNLLLQHLGLQNE